MTNKILEEVTEPAPPRITDQTGARAIAYYRTAEGWYFEEVGAHENAGPMGLPLEDFEVGGFPTLEAARLSAHDVPEDPDDADWNQVYPCAEAPWGALFDDD